MPFSAPIVYEVGRRSENFVANGMDLTAMAASEMAAYVTMLAARRRKVLYAKAAEFSQSAAAASISACFVGAWRTSAEVRAVSVAILCMPADTNATGVTPNVAVRVIADPGGAPSPTTQPRMHLGKRKTSTPVPDDLFWVTQTWDGKGGTTALTANTEYASYLDRVWTRVLSVVIFEEPWTSFKTTTVTGVSPASYVTGAPLLDTAADAPGDRMLSLWKNQAPVVFNWGRTDGNGSDLYIDNTTYQNVFDPSLADWDSAAYGFWAYPRYQGSYHSNNVPCVFWAYGTMGGSSTSGTVAFRASAGGTLATVTITSVAEQYVSATGNLDATQDTQLIQVFAKRDSTQEMILYGFGCYQYES